ncbi:MAG TPA: glycosyltransferase [Candidatus Saccharimonadales bacterium]|nr:glycosyltransferase [Candidatus Saccharimonadales bacterium]
MKIGIFTDTYHPSVNGIVAVTDILRRNFEAFGHEVFVFAPGEGLKTDDTDAHLIRFPAVKGVLYDDFNASLFFVPTVLADIKKLDLDVIHFLTPGQVGLMGLYAAHELKIPLVSEYCTDLFEYVAHYPIALPVLIAAISLLPLAVPMSPYELLAALKASRPRLGVTKWNKALVKELLTILHASCDAVIVHSRKSARQLSSWQTSEFSYRSYLIPTGVDHLPVPTPAKVEAFKKKFSIAITDEVVVYVGRLSAEKNLDVLIPAIEQVRLSRPHAKLLFVGDFDYRPTLEAKARASTAAQAIIFAGQMPRTSLGTPLALAKVFVFPSLSDTQGLVLHEAALAGLPIVLTDQLVSEVVKNNQNGLFAKPNPTAIAEKIVRILASSSLQKSMGSQSKQIAGHFSERAQAQKIITLYTQIIRQRKRLANSRLHS